MYISVCMYVHRYTNVGVSIWYVYGEFSGHNMIGFYPLIRFDKLPELNTELTVQQ